MQNKPQQIKQNRIVTIFMAVFFTICLLLPAGALAELPGKGKMVIPCYNGIAEEKFQILVLMKGLEKMGYSVKQPLELEVTSMHLAVGQGDADFTAHHWNPLHQKFFEKVGGAARVSRVGTLIQGAYQGYMIDKKTADKYGIKTLNDFAKPEIAKLFDSNGDGKADLTGANPGWGAELVINHELKAYHLEKTVSHNQGSYFALMADTIARYKSGKSVFYYTYTPQWINGVLVPGKDVVWLTVTHTDLPPSHAGANTVTPDGRNLGFAINNIHVFANNGFLEKNPAANRFFELATIPINDINAQNMKMKNGEKSEKDIDRHADEWIAAHQETFDKWIAEAVKAAE